MKLRTHLQKTRIAKYISDFNFNKIKKKNLNFSVTYSETGSRETFTDTLNWSEIEKPKNSFIEVLKITVLENGKAIKELTKPQSKRLLFLLDSHNRKTVMSN